jgi:hypothetical protein
MRGLDPRIHLLRKTFFAKIDGLQRKSGLPDFRKIFKRRKSGRPDFRKIFKRRKSGRPDLRCQARQ